GNPVVDEIGIRSYQGASADDPDALLRRLRELGELHRDGVLTDEEFSLAKQAVLRRL
ncbi:SHOCT domain-containing protein, partial [Streptomyces sp. S5]|uniref:SHOCT domain-containing protein n=1 Tax=Streptomyces sp. S5 TaxID=1456735 RepID=UPI001969B6AE